jgi:Ca2+-binding RTX toxin-like protein
MTKHKITGSHTETVYITGNDGIWTVTQGAEIIVDGQAALDTGETTGNTINVYGTVSASDSLAVYTWGDHTTFNVGKAGSITGSIQIVGADDHFTNNGTLEAPGFVLSVDSDGGLVENNGEISSPGTSLAPVQLSGDHLTFINGEEGVVTGASAAVAVASATDEHVKIKNFGVINSGVSSNDSNDRIVNRGTVNGSIATGWGNDVIDNRHGTVTVTFEGQTSPGTIAGGPGDDVFVTDDAASSFTEFEGGGDDTIKSSVSYKLDPDYYVEHLVLIGKADIDGRGTMRGEDIVGNAGDNLLRGLNGDDRLDGKGGNDKLEGDLGVDLFVFGKGYGKDTIQDFTQGTDHIDIGGLGLRPNFNDVLAHAHDHNGNVWIQVHDDILVIRHLQTTELTAADFGLIP